MVAYVVLPGVKHDTTWHIGSNSAKELKALDINGDVTNSIVEIQADGDELDYILQRCSNIPVAIGCRVMSWYGDHAKFIFANVMCR